MADEADFSAEGWMTMLRNLTRKDDKIKFALELSVPMKVKLFEAFVTSPLAVDIADYLAIVQPIFDGHCPEQFPKFFETVSIDILSTAVWRQSTMTACIQILRYIPEKQKPTIANYISVMDTIDKSLADTHRVEVLSTIWESVADNAESRGNFMLSLNFKTRLLLSNIIARKERNEDEYDPEYVPNPVYFAPPPPVRNNLTPVDTSTTSASISSSSPANRELRQTRKTRPTQPQSIRTPVPGEESDDYELPTIGDIDDGDFSDNSDYIQNNEFVHRDCASVQTTNDNLNRTQIESASASTSQTLDEYTGPSQEYSFESTTGSNIPSSPCAPSKYKRFDNRARLNITPESLCFRLGFPRLEQHKVYREKLSDAKLRCNQIDFSKVWEDNSQRSRKWEVRRLVEHWGGEVTLEVAEECLKACCGWPDTMVPGDPIPDCHPNKRLLLQRVTPDSLRYRMGFCNYDTDPLSEVKYRERRQELKREMPGISWNSPWSHNDLSTRTIAMAQAMANWAPLYAFSEPLVREVAISLCANRSVVVRRPEVKEFHAQNPGTQLRKGRKKKTTENLSSSKNPYPSITMFGYQAKPHIVADISGSNSGPTRSTSFQATPTRSTSSQETLARLKSSQATVAISNSRRLDIARREQSNIQKLPVALVAKRQLGEQNESDGDDDLYSDPRTVSGGVPRAAQVRNIHHGRPAVPAPPLSIFKVFSDSTKKRKFADIQRPMSKAQAAHLDPVVLSDDHEQESNEDDENGDSQASSMTADVRSRVSNPNPL